MQVLNDNRCSWVNDLNLRLNIKFLASNENCDWLIVGAGYTGLSAARKLGELYPNQKVTSDAYAASKAAIIQLTKYYAVNLTKHNIRVNCISPGGIFNNQNTKLIKNYIKKVPLKRMANIKEIIGSVELLLSDKSKYINGHNLIVDGGYTIL